MNLTDGPALPATNLRKILEEAGDRVVEVLPNGEMNIIGTDPAIDKAFNAGIERCARWHKTMYHKEWKSSVRGSTTRARFHELSSDILRELKRR